DLLGSPVTCADQLTLGLGTHSGGGRRNDATKRCLARINSTGELRAIVECNDNDSYATVEWYAQGASWRRVVFSHWYGNTNYAVDSNFTGGAYAYPWNGGLHQQWNFKS
ncbi:hypothetical protein ACSDR0_47535, partial [Streptosporangium sp. G11]|uniref:hypothetical protein n=1 Tax=Streptosporangium sp. G11 TaxID=3436926 RepID=UPI003EBAA4BA